MTTMKVFDGTAWQVASLPAGTNATTFVGPEAPPGPLKVGDLWYDTDEVTPPFIPLPVSIVNGGTGQSTAATARSGLAVPAIGNSTTTAGAPTTGSWARGDQWLDSNTVLWLCTAAGTPGTWANKNIGEELAYNQTTTQVNITSTAAASAALLIEGTTRSYDGTPIMVECHLPMLQQPTGAGLTVVVALWDGATDLGGIAQYFALPSGGGPVTGRRRIVPTPGTHNYRIAAWVNSGMGILYCGATGAGTSQGPAFVRVIRV
jgi:hypothetical protein